MVIYGHADTIGFNLPAGEVDSIHNNVCVLGIFDIETIRGRPDAHIFQAGWGCNLYFFSGPAFCGLDPNWHVFISDGCGTFVGAIEGVREIVCAMRQGIREGGDN